MVLKSMEARGHSHNGHSYSTFEVFFGNGRSYYVTEEVYDGVNIGDSCVATLLPHTNKLLDLYWAGELTPRNPESRVS